MEYFEKLIKRLRVSDSVKNVLILILGSGFSQFIVLLITPILTRIYKPAFFAQYFIFLSAINILKQVFTLRFELTIVIVNDKKLEFLSLAITFILNTLFSFLSTVLIILFNKIFQIRYINLLFFIILSSYVMANIEIVNYWNNKNRNYKTISISKIYSILFISIFQIMLFFIKIPENKLVLGHFLGLIFTLLFLIIKIRFKDIWVNVFSNLSKIKFLYLIKKYNNILKFNSLINLLSNLLNETPIYIISYFFGQNYTAIYGMVNKIIGNPMNLIGQSISNVFFRNVSEKYNEGDIKSYFFTVSKKLYKLGFILSFLIFLLSFFVEFYLGKDWKGISFYIILLLPAYYLNFINQPLLSIPTILNIQKEYIFILSLFIILRSVSLIVGYRFNNFYLALAFFSIVGVVFGVIIFKWLEKRVKMTPVGLKPTTLRSEV